MVSTERLVKKGEEKKKKKKKRDKTGNLQDVHESGGKSLVVRNIRTNGQ